MASLPVPQYNTDTLALLKRALEAAFWQMAVTRSAASRHGNEAATRVAMAKRIFEKAATGERDITALATHALRGVVAR